MKKLRQILFWLHLVTGLAAGIVIFVMSFTGAALSFESQLIKWAERDARQITPPTENAPRLPLDEMLQRTRSGRPDFRLVSVTVSRDPNAAVMLSGSTNVTPGRPTNVTLCVNPFTGESREPNAPGMRNFMHAMRSWHIHLDSTIGDVFTSTGNVLFLGLGLSGLWLWWPSAWKWRVIRPSLWFQSSAHGRARDWNWHNVFGFWSLPMLILMTSTGVVLSYEPVNALMFRLAGDPLPAPQSAVPATAAPPLRAPAPSAPAVITPDFVTSTVTPLLAAVQTDIPTWREAVLRLSPPDKASAVVDYRASWPPFSSATFTFNRATGEVQRGNTYEAASAGRRARMWVRLTHSGQSFGWPGQLMAGLACLGGCMLVWTGFAMAWRRFFGRPSA